MHSRNTALARRPQTAAPPGSAKLRLHIVAFVLLTLLIGGIYLSVLAGDASLKTNTTPPLGPLFVIDPTAGGFITMPMGHLAILAWSHLNLPIIDPFQGYGFPLIASQGIPVFPPEVLLHLLISHNYSTWNVLRVLLIAWGTYLLASSFELSFVASLAAGVAASLIGIVPPNINLGMLNPIMLLPFVLLALRYLLDPDRQRSPFLP
jgi:hypothetical protein